MNTPNALSLARIFLAGAFTIFMSTNYSWSYQVALGCFIFASLTDWLDGYLARKWNLITDLGKLLDPLADKILVAAAFVCFTEKGLCPAWATVLILFREFSVTGLRLLLVEKGTVLPADGWGKWKTVSQMVYCVFILCSLTFTFPDSLKLAGNILLGVTLFLTLFSGMNYFIKAEKLLKLFSRA